MKNYIKPVLKYILPILIIIVIYTANNAAGTAALLIFVSYRLYTGRAALCAFIGSIKYSRGTPEEALKWFKRGYETHRSSPKSVISYAYLLLKTGRPDEAGTVLEKLLEKKPGKEEELYAKSNLALVYWKKGDLDLAVSTLQAVVAEYKTSSVYGSLGYLLILKGDLDKALEFNLEAYDFNSSNTVILDNLGQNYYLKGMYDKSLEIYETLIAKNPTFPEAWYNYALVLIKLERSEMAAEMLKKALNSKFSYLSDITRDMVETKLNEVDRNLNP